MRKFLIVAICLIVAFATTSALAKDYSGKKVLYIDSYHEGYAWSDGIRRGIESIFKETGVELKVIYMDTKRNTSEEFKKEAALKAKTEIETFQPDVVIAADDNASKYLIVPHFKDVDLPFVFCGVNWDATPYGYPFKNVTGMIEVTPLPQIVDQLRPYAAGDRIGFIGPDVLTAHKEVENYKTIFGYDMITYFTSSADDFMSGFESLQEKVDMLIIDSDAGLYDDQRSTIETFFLNNTKIPTGSAYDFMAPLTLISFGKVAEEQGGWSAQTVLKILDGTSPSSIPLEKNKRGSLIINAKIANKLGVDIPYELIESADKVIE